jgi:periplasmic divalent cation tolerance protein
MTQVIEVITTTSTREDAARIADALVNCRLAACVQIEGPLESRYIWQGKLTCETEWKCTAKTLGDRFAEVERAIRELHKYEIPQIVFLTVAHVSADYLDWLTKELGAEEP